jgi:serine O-acetyltransferase
MTSASSSARCDRSSRDWRALDADVEAAYTGDAAATSRDEVRLAYPGVQAVAVYRIAHWLDRRGVPLVPRVLSDCARETTGAELHPRAEIGAAFFIDHATGVIVGETARIGDRVTLYEGVVLGVTQLELDPSGHLRKGAQRHPTLEDDVTVFAHAMVLGGATTIGARSTVGARALVTQSIPPDHLARPARTELHVTPLVSKA